jgi:hypothetical protein
MDFLVVSIQKPPFVLAGSSIIVMNEIIIDHYSFKDALPFVLQRL